jgi:hypothetical protein
MTASQEVKARLQSLDAEIDRKTKLTFRVTNRFIADLGLSNSRWYTIFESKLLLCLTLGSLFVSEAYSTSPFLHLVVRIVAFVVVVYFVVVTTIRREHDLALTRLSGLREEREALIDEFFEATS